MTAPRRVALFLTDRFFAMGTRVECHLHGACAEPRNGDVEIDPVRAQAFSTALLVAHPNEREQLLNRLRGARARVFDHKDVFQ